MATLVLGTVGKVFGGPVGGLIGTFLGASIDRAIFGGPGKRGGTRVSDLAVQSSAYGEPIPRIYGRLRVAGNLIWSPGIHETASRSGGKHSGGSTNYTYSASFAVALSARPIAGIGRIWADGKLLRNADGSQVIPATVRLYHGGENQPADPLIVAAEGPAFAPAYRGLSYVVFENLALADFANRIPNLTFEVIADDGGTSAGTIIADLCAGAGVAIPSLTGSAVPLHGFVAGSAGSLRTQIEPLVMIGDLAFRASASGLALRSGADTAAVALADDQLGTTPANELAGVRGEDSRQAAGTLPDALSIGFYDPSRDYQLGSQRGTRRSPAVRVEMHDLPVALDAPAAKIIADRLIAAAVAARTTAEILLPWRHAGLQAGATVVANGVAWRIRRVLFEAMVVKLSVERVPANASGSATADAGRSMNFGDLPNGPTLFEVLDLPPLPGPLPATPRLWLAVGGSTAGWKRAIVEVSGDGGETYALVTEAFGPATIGTAQTVLGQGISDRWDHISTVDVSVPNTALWLESRTPAAVLGGANLAVIGDEILQFANVQALSPGRFRLSELLRGRRGTEAAIGTHAAGERFVLLDAGKLIPFDPPLDLLGTAMRFRAAGRDDPPVTGVARTLPLLGRALQPLAPVYLRTAVSGDGGMTVRWIRCSRSGFAWTDGIDAPLSEAREAWRVEVRLGSTVRRTADVATPAWSYDAAMRLADGLGGAAEVTIAVIQMSAEVGRGNASQITVTLPPL